MEPGEESLYDVTMKFFRGTTTSFSARAVPALRVKQIIAEMHASMGAPVPKELRAWEGGAFSHTSEDGQSSTSIEHAAQ